MVGRVFISLLEGRPDIAAQLDCVKSNLPDIGAVSLYSHHVFWWYCSVCGYSWKAPVNGRTIGAGKCPACMGFAVTDKNNLAVVYPHLLKEWDYTKNVPLTPPKCFLSRPQEGLVEMCLLRVWLGDVGCS